VTQGKFAIRNQSAIHDVMVLRVNEEVPTAGVTEGGGTMARIGGR
jgi:hypothetical protein